MIYLSIITVCKNNYPQIKRCISNVPDNDFIEHIIVDGRSDDETDEVISETLLKKKNVVALTEIEPSGIYKALNLGIQLATGRFILILNGDDELVQVESVMPLLVESSADILIAKQLASLVDGTAISVGYEKQVSAPVQKMPWAHGAMFVSMKFFEQVGDYDTTYLLSSDLEWINRALRSTPRLVFHDDYVSKFNFGGVSTTTLNGVFESRAIYQAYGGSKAKANITFLKGILIKLIAQRFGWSAIFAIRKYFSFKKGIWN